MTPNIYSYIIKELLHWYRWILSRGGISKDASLRASVDKILSKSNKYPGNSFYSWVNRGENILVLNEGLTTLTIWRCHMAVHFGFLYKCWNKGCFKHKKGSFLFSQIKTWNTAEFKRMKQCFILTEIAKCVMEIYDWTQMNQFKKKKKKKRVQKSLLVCVSWPQTKC